MEVVNEILSNIDKNKNEALQSIEVHKLIEPDFYPQELLVSDTNEINYNELRENQEDYLLNYSRNCAQYLVNKLSAFSKETKDGLVYFKTSGLEFNLPREKPIPTPKPLTKWQRFIKEKGLKKTKKPRVTWDDILQKWVPTYGYKKAMADKDKNWLLEVPQNVDPNTDMFAEKKKIKKENIAKNEYQRLRNIANSKKIKVPQVGVPPLEGKMLPTQLQSAAILAKSSTASLGKFQPKLPLDKDTKKAKLGGNKPKKFKSPAEEKSVQMQINNQLHEELRHKPAKEKSDNDQSTSKKNKKKKGKSSFKKPKSNQGKKAGKKGGGGGGRKRR